jgi:hypothetical protein
VVDKVSNEALLAAALRMMEAQGNALEKIKTGSRAMKYRLANGQIVRARTCNDHVLVVLAVGPEAGAKLNIEGTEHLLVAMPETQRTEGAVIAYFVPTNTAVSAVRKSRAEWLASGPSTRGHNTTWNIWFDDLGDAPWGGFARKWARYRIPGEASTLNADPLVDQSRVGSRTLGAIMTEARLAIATAAGVAPDAVKISIDLG